MGSFVWVRRKVWPPLSASKVTADDATGLVSDFPATRASRLPQKSPSTAKLQDHAVERGDEVAECVAVFVGRHDLEVGRCLTEHFAAGGDRRFHGTTFDGALSEPENVRLVAIQDDLADDVPLAFAARLEHNKAKFYL